MTDDPDEGATADLSDPASWGIKENTRRDEDKRAIASRVGKRVGDEWVALIDKIAKDSNVTKGSAWGAGLLVAMKHQDEWQALIEKIKADAQPDDGSSVATLDA